MKFIRTLLAPFTSIRAERDPQLEEAHAELRQSRQALQSSTRVILGTMSGMVKITQEAASAKPN